MSNAQITELYEVSMAHSYVRERMTAPATFGLSVRKLPPGRGFLVAAEARLVTDPRPPEAAGSDLLRELSEVIRGRIESRLWTMPARPGAALVAAPGFSDRSRS